MRSSEGLPLGGGQSGLQGDLGGFSLLILSGGGHHPQICYTDSSSPHSQPMGTRSRIGLALGPDQIISVYCHYDGYIQYTGRKLIDNYLYKEQVEELINGGDMSSLHSTHMWESAPLKQTIHHADGTKTVDYMRDADDNWVYSPVKATPSPLYYSERGEDAPPKIGDFDDFLSGNCGEEWCYLFTPGDGWQCWKLGWGDTNTAEYDFLTEEPLTVGKGSLVTV